MFFSPLGKYDNSEKSGNIFELTSNLEGVGSYVTRWFAMIIMKQMLWTRGTKWTDKHHYLCCEVEQNKVSQMAAAALCVLWFSLRYVTSLIWPPVNAKNSRHVSFLHEETNR